METAVAPGKTARRAANPVGTARRARRWNPLVLGLQALVFVAAIGLWQLVTATGLIKKFFISQPTLVGARLVQWFSTGTIWKHIEATMYETVLSFAIGVGLGIAFGFLLARSDLLAKVFSPYLAMLNALPRVVLAPIFVL